MITAKDDTEHDDALSFDTLERLERLISTCVGDVELFSFQLTACKTEQEGQNLIQELLKCQGIPGYHFTPHSLSEQKEAIQRAVDLDDFKERRK